MKKILAILSFLLLVNIISASPVDSISSDSGQIGISSLNVIKQNIQPQQNNSQDNIKFYDDWWKSTLLILVLAFLTLLLLKFSNEISDISKAFINQSYATELYHNRSSVFQNLFSVFNFLALIFAAIIFYLYKDKIENQNSLNILLIVSLLIVGFYFSKLIIASLWSYSTGEKKSFQIIMFHTKLSNFILSFLFITALFIIVINPNCNKLCFQIILIISLIVYLIKYINITRDFFGHGFSLFYLILYLCTVEILPIIIFFRLYLTDFKQI